MPGPADDPRFHRPIPDGTEPPNWARLPIEECGELLSVVEESHALLVHSAYADLGLPGAVSTLQLRAGALARLQRAAQSLPPSVALCLFDGFRPLSVQQHLYTGYWQDVARDHPDWNATAIARQVQQFVALPNPSLDAPPPHRTGGAADVYLVDRVTGAPLPMGTQPDEISPRSVTRWYEDYPEAPYTRNRRLLFHTLTAQGFTNYSGEWWHYDFGNQRWANLFPASAARYGAPASERAPDAWEWVPRHKSDLVRARRAAQAGYPAVAPVLPELLAWLQDVNWPVTPILTDLLGTIGEPLAPYLRLILKGSDAIGKAVILHRLIAPSTPLRSLLRPELEPLAASAPTTSDEAAVTNLARALLAEMRCASS